MRSLNSSKLDLTGCVTPELCIVNARSCHPSSELLFGDPLTSHTSFRNLPHSLVRDLILSQCTVRKDDSDNNNNHHHHNNNNNINNDSSSSFTCNEENKISYCNNNNANNCDSVCDGASASDRELTSRFSVSSIEAIRAFSDYFETSLQTDSRLRECIADLSLHQHRDHCPQDELPEVECCNDQQAAVESETQDSIFASIFTCSSHTNSPPSNFCCSLNSSKVLPQVESDFNMKNKKKGVEESAEEDMLGKCPGILKSVLKKGSKKDRKKKHKVQFDESMNKFFEADYVILVRDEDYDDEFGRCECGNQFCYEGCYYDDDDEYEGYEHSVDSPRYDFAAAFDPPVEFVDPVTLSPPDGYKDGCCPQPSYKMSASAATGCARHEDVEGHHSDNREKLRNENLVFNDRSKTKMEETAYGTKNNLHNQANTSQPNDFKSTSQLAMFNDTGEVAANSSGGSVGPSRYIVETITMTTVTEHRIIHGSNDQIKLPPTDYSSDGILKGGESCSGNAEVTSSHSPAPSPQDDKRGVKFIQDDESMPSSGDKMNCDKENFDKGEFTLTFKLGNRVVPCNSLKPNSAVRQLFPDPRFANLPSEGSSEIDCEDNLGKCEGKYLVTEESLRAFNEVNKRSVFAKFNGKEKYPYKDGTLALNSDDEDIPEDNLVKKTIERNTLRRSLLRYPRGERNKGRGKEKSEVSLEERIKQLTCNIDDEHTPTTVSNPQICTREVVMSQRSDPQGAKNTDTGGVVGSTVSALNTKGGEKSTYKKFTNLFRGKGGNQGTGNTMPAPAVASEGVGAGPVTSGVPYYQPVYPVVPLDLGIDMQVQNPNTLLFPAKKGQSTNEARKQFLTSLAPLTACVSSHLDQQDLKLTLPGDRHSIISMDSTGTDYSLGDIDDALSKPLRDGNKGPQPDVLAGTPMGGEGNELAMFVQQDAGRIERIKKRYNASGATSVKASCATEDDEHDDYGFSQRPSVRGIKPRFGSTTEILQQIQAHLQPPTLGCPTKAGSHMTWPYYSAEVLEATKSTTTTTPLPPLPPHQEEMYKVGKQNSEHTPKLVWGKGLPPPPPQRGVTLQQQQQSNPNIHMFHLGPFESMAEVSVPPKVAPGTDVPSTSHCITANNIFQMKVSPISHMRLPMNMSAVTAGGQYTTHPIPVGTTSVIRVGHGQQQTFRVPCPVSGPVQVHLLATHHYETPQVQSSQPIHFSPQIMVAKDTQTSSISTTSFYQLQKLQTNAPGPYPLCTAVAASSSSCSTTTTEQAKLIQVNYATAATHIAPSNLSLLNSSPARAKSQNNLTERGVPEGAPSGSSTFPHDWVKPQTDGSNSTKSTATMVYGMKV